MTILKVLHRTQYRYANAVTFGDHRMMMRPRDSHDLRLIDTGLTISPPAQVRWMFDVFRAATWATVLSLEHPASATRRAAAARPAGSQRKIVRIIMRLQR